MVHVRPFWEWGVSGSRFGVELRVSWVLVWGLGFGYVQVCFLRLLQPGFQTLRNILP